MTKKEQNPSSFLSKLRVLTTPFYIIYDKLRTAIKVNRREFIVMALIDGFEYERGIMPPKAERV